MASNLTGSFYTSITK